MTAADPQVLVDRARAAGCEVAAIEAYWTGDRDGLWIALVAIVEQPSWQHPRYTEIALARIPAGRTHTGPAWPEAAEVAALGETVSRALCVPLHFPAHARPSDETARWWHRGRAKPCIDCGALLDQNPAVHWFGMCYACHLVREDQTPRVRVELVHDLDARGFERIRDVVDAALCAANVGRFYAGSRLSGQQGMWFLCSHPRRAAELAIRVLGTDGSLGNVRIRIAGSSTDAGELVWPGESAAAPAGI